MVAATANAVSIPKPDKQIESKAKVAKVKITWNANGGKIGPKKIITSSIKRGAKLNKLATAKRNGYTFQGWYTKKTGGKKISKNTKVSKKVTFYAHWKKKSRALNTAEKKLIGTWSYFTSNGGSIVTFNGDGTFGKGARIQIGSNPANSYYWEGIWHVTGTTLYMTNLKAQTTKGFAQWEGGRLELYDGKWEPYPLINPNSKYTHYKIGIDERGKYLQYTPTDIKLYNG